MLDHLPERDRPAVQTRLRRAWKDANHQSALEQLMRFHGVEGYRGLAGLAVKIEHDLIRKRQLDSHTSAQEELATLAV